MLQAEFWIEQKDISRDRPGLLYCCTCSLPNCLNILVKNCDNEA